jgi:large subunit ribosomal protein L4
MPSVKVIKADGSDGGTASVDAHVAPGNHHHVVYEAVKMYQANKRLGSVHKKNRSEVAGGGRKPWRQKGTGRARQGTIRAPQWRGGGRAFPPHERDFSYAIPKKIRRLATRTALGARAEDGTLLVLESLPEITGRTREVASLLRSLGVEGRRVLLLLDRASPELLRASRNIPGLVVNRFAETNALQVLQAERVFVAAAALESGKEAE